MNPDVIPSGAIARPDNCKVGEGDGDVVACGSRDVPATVRAGVIVAGVVGRVERPAWPWVAAATGCWDGKDMEQQKCTVHS